MYKFVGVIASIIAVLTAECSENTGNGLVQTPVMRKLCDEAQQIEKKMADLSSNLENLDRQEKTAAPVVRDVYTILTRCFTVLFDIQRFSKFLAFAQQDNKNDFVRCSIIIKNFANYFNSIGHELKKAKNDVFTVRKTTKQCLEDMKAAEKRYGELCAEIETEATNLSKTRKENMIQEDVVYHIASKSESIDELDAELEAENAVGVLKNTKIKTELTISRPVSGKIVGEFGDKGSDGKMIRCMTFEVKSGAIVTSPCKGLVVFAGQFLDYGNMVIISNGEYRVFLYGLDKMFATTGDVVEIGDYIGKAALSHNNEKVLLKLELKKSGEPLDPRHWILISEEKKKGENA